MTNPKVRVIDRRRARDAAHQPRSLRRHRLGAVESVPRRHRQPVHARVLPRGERAADRGRRLRAVGAGLRDRRADAAHHLRDDGGGVSAGRNVADRPPATWCCSRRRGRAATTRPRCARASPRSRSSRRSPTRGAPSTSTACSRTIVATDAVARAFAADAARRDQHRRSQPRRVRPGAIGRPRRMPCSSPRSARWPQRSARRARRSTATPASTGPPSETAWANFVEWDAQTAACGRESAGGGAAAGRAAPLLPGGDVSGARGALAPASAAAARSVGAGDGGRPRGRSRIGRGAAAHRAVARATSRPKRTRSSRRCGCASRGSTKRRRRSSRRSSRLRVDPWPLRRFKQKALALADGADRRAIPPASRRLFDALRQPFSLRAFDEMRLLTMTDLSTRFDFVGTCREPIGALEPLVPVDGGVPAASRRDCYQATDDPRLASGHARPRGLLRARAAAARSALSAGSARQRCQHGRRPSAALGRFKAQRCLDCGLPAYIVLTSLSLIPDP